MLGRLPVRHNEWSNLELQQRLEAHRWRLQRERDQNWGLLPFPAEFEAADELEPTVEPNADPDQTSSFGAVVLPPPQQPARFFAAQQSAAAAASKVRQRPSRILWSKESYSLLSEGIRCVRTRVCASRAL